MASLRTSSLSRPSKRRLHKNARRIPAIWPFSKKITGTRQVEDHTRPRLSRAPKEVARPTNSIRSSLRCQPSLDPLRPMGKNCDNYPTYRAGNDKTFET